MVSLLPFLALGLMLEGEDVTDLSAKIQSVIDGTNVPSLAAAAVLDGEIVALGAAGIRKLGDKTAVEPEDRYHIGSCTKSMTAVLGAILIEAGKFNWDTTVSDAFPGIKIHEGYQPVTFEQLVTNTGGTPANADPDLWKQLWERRGTNEEQRMQLVEGVLQNEPAYPPGSDEVYSNVGFAIAGAMLESITGTSFETLLTEELFRPLGMSTAGFGPPSTEGKIDQPYGHARSFFRVKSVGAGPESDNPPAIAPAGAVHCSIADFAKYAIFHLGAGENSPLSLEGVRSLHVPPSGNSYAKGWVVTERAWAGGSALTHTGSNTSFYSVIWIAPERNFAAVALCNFGGTEGFKKCDEVIGYLIEKFL